MQKALTKRLLIRMRCPTLLAHPLETKSQQFKAREAYDKRGETSPQISVTTKYIKSTIGPYSLPFRAMSVHRGGNSCNLTSYCSCYVQELT